MIRDRIANYFRAGFPCIAIQTPDEARAAAEVLAAAKELKRAVVSWDALQGARIVTEGDREIEDTNDLLGMCRMGRLMPDLKTLRRNTVYVLRDPHMFPMDIEPRLARAWRTFLTEAPAAGCCVVVIAPRYEPHATCEKMVQIIDLPYPDAALLLEVAKQSAIDAGESPENVPPEIVRSLAGLTVSEAQNACALSWIESDNWDLEVIQREKVTAVKRAGLLSVVAREGRGMAAVGGFDMLKRWAQRRRRLFTPEARAYGTSEPKGILLVGPPGAGKSLVAKVIGAELGVTVIRLDVAALFNALVGESEANTRAALAQCESQAPCVVWLDEIEKAFAGASSSEGGPAPRVLMTFLTWMQERAPGVFIVATANDVRALPPELLRKGRFDEIFAVDLPSQTERAEIASIVLRAAPRNRDAAAFDLDAIATVTRLFVGSEIEACIDNAMIEAFSDDREVTTADIVASAAATVPLALTAREKIESVREWSRTRARQVSSAPREALPDAPEGGEAQGGAMMVGIVAMPAPAPEARQPRAPKGKKN